jgi:hypothetical protein
MLLKLQPATQTDEPWMHASQLAHHWLAAIATQSGSEEEKRHVGHMLICHNVRDDPKQPKRSMGSSDVTRVLSSAIKQAGQYGNTLCFDLSSHPRQQANRLAPERLNQDDIDIMAIHLQLALHVENSWPCPLPTCLP